MAFMRNLLMVFAVFLLASCGGGGGSGNRSELSLRILHVAPDAPLATIRLNNRVISRNVDYQQGTPFILLTGGTYDIAVDFTLANGSTERVVDLQDQALSSEQEYTVMALGLMADNDVESLVITNPLTDIPAGTARLQLVHGTAGVPDLDIYVTTPDAALDAPFATLAYRDHSERVSLPAGEYQIRVTPAGDAGTVLFDSGTLAFSTNDDLLMVASPNAGTGTSPLTFMVNDGFSSTRIFDVDTQAELRVLNLSRDAPAMKVTAEPTSGDPATDLTTGEFPAGVPYAGRTSYQVLPSERYEFTAVDAANESTVLFERTSTLLRNQRVTLAAVGLLENVGSVLLFDDVRPIATEGRLRVLNGSTSETFVDVYVTAPGTDINSTSPAFQSLGLGSASNYRSIVPGDYQITVTKSGTKNSPVSEAVPLPAGSAFTVIIRDGPAGLPLVVDLESDLP
jgi:hypothetical protein